MTENNEVSIRLNGRDTIINRKVLQKQTPDLDAWLSFRMGKTFGSDDLKRLGFCDARRELEDVDSRHWEIKRIFLASGKEQGMTAGKYYASEKVKGGTETFWEILFHSIRSHVVSIEGEPGSPIMSDLEFDLMKPSVEIVYSPSRRAAFMDSLDELCRANPGRFFKLWCPGHRPPSGNVGEYIIRGAAPYCYAPNGECIRASLANALFALHGEGKAREVLQHGPVNCRSLSASGNWLERKLRMFRLQKITVPKHSDIEDWLIAQRTGVFVVTLAGFDSDYEQNHHVITIDAGRRLVYDCMEKTALKMKSGVLDVCVGDGYSLLGVEEIRQITEQKKGSGKNKNRNMPRHIQKIRRDGRCNKRPSAGSSQSGKRKRSVCEDSDIDAA